jgi:hypothetical protein
LKKGGIDGVSPQIWLVTPFWSGRNNPSASIDLTTIIGRLDMKSKSLELRVVLFLFFLFACSTSASATLVDFEGLGLESGSPVPDIGIASFTARAAVYGTPYAFFSSGGANVANSAPFNQPGNTLITNVGGVQQGVSTTTLEIFFSTPVTALGFLVADIDSAPAATIQERLTATVYDSSNSILGNVVITAPAGTTGNPGDGDVLPVDFGAVSGITRLLIQVENIAGDPDNSGVGWGLDNLQFTAVPIPTSVWLLASGLAGLAALRRRFRK